MKYIINRSRSTKTNDFKPFLFCLFSFFTLFLGAKPVDPRIYISSNLSDSSWISIYDKKQWEYLNGLQVMLADLMANKDYSNNGLSKTMDEVNLFLSVLTSFN